MKSQVLWNFDELAYHNMSSPKSGYVIGYKLYEYLKICIN
jgi:hypothetical protein